jgi:desulfoferrodoxin (superoxide reductase-like protein)
LLTRRRLLQTSAAVAALPLLPACGPEAADGTLARPFTREDPGPWAEKIEVHQPVVYGALVDDTRVRIWVEVEDQDKAVTHEQTPEHFVSRILVQDQDGAVLGDAVYPYEAAARLVVVLDLPATVTALRVYEECNKHGIWLASYDVKDLKVAPGGDARRPLTKDQPGPWAEKIATHVPVLTKVDAATLRVEIGDVAADKMHVTQVDHYIVDVVVYDQNAQEIARVPIGQNLPTFDMPIPAGTTSVRVVAWCNLHDHWESELAL